MEVLPHLLHESMKPPNFKIGCNVSTGVMINIEFEARACEWDCIICGFLEELGAVGSPLSFLSDRHARVRVPWRTRF